MRIIRSYLDLLGFSASFLCAVHCLLMPLVLSFGLVGGMSWLESAWVEWSFILSTLVLASWSLVSSFPKHRNSRPLLFAGLGFVLIVVLHHLFEDTIGHYLAAIGGAMVAYAHYMNWRLLRRKAITTELQLTTAEAA
ncbi:MAG: MerC domain-containing protein [Bacteroidota bacterium]